jgi:hypothetical protein
MLQVKKKVGVYTDWLRFSILLNQDKKQNLLLKVYSW